MSNKIVLTRNLAGVIPPYLLLELARRNPDKLQYIETLAATQRLFKSSEARLNPHSRFKDAGNSSIEVYDCNAGEDRPGTKARFEGEPATGNADDERRLDDVAHVEEGLALPIERLTGLDMRRQKPRQRQIDAPHLVKVDRIVERGEPRDFVGGQRQRRIGAELGPALGREEPVG